MILFWIWKGIPGVLIGRYENDVYQGGNPWILITAELAKLLFRAAIVVKHGKLGDGIEKWKNILNIGINIIIIITIVIRVYNPKEIILN